MEEWWLTSQNKTYFKSNSFLLLSQRIQINFSLRTCGDILQRYFRKPHRHRIICLCSIVKWKWNASLGTKKDRPRQLNYSLLKVSSSNVLQARLQLGCTRLHPRLSNETHAENLSWKFGESGPFIKLRHNYLISNIKCSVKSLTHQFSYHSLVHANIIYKVSRWTIEDRNKPHKLNQPSK